MKNVHISMPRFEVDGEGALTLTAPLIHVPSGFVKHTEHRHETVRMAVRSANVGAGSADFGDGETDTARRFGNLSALLQCVVDAVDRIRGHGEQEAG